MKPNLFNLKIYQSFCLFDYHISIPFGSQAAKERLINIFRTQRLYYKNSEEDSNAEFLPAELELPEEFISTILGTCFATIACRSSTEGVQLSVPFNNGLLKIPDALRSAPFEVFFEDDESISSSLLKCLEKALSI